MEAWILTLMDHFCPLAFVMTPTLVVLFKMILNERKENDTVVFKATIMYLTFNLEMILLNVRSLQRKQSLLSILRLKKRHLLACWCLKIHRISILLFMRGLSLGSILPPRKYVRYCSPARKAAAPGYSFSLPPTMKTQH